MSASFVLAPVPPARRRRPRANSRSSGSSTACSRSTGTRSRSGSTTSYSSRSQSRTRSRRPSFRTASTPRRTSPTSSTTNHLTVPASESFVSFADSPLNQDTNDQFAAYLPHHHHQTVSASTTAIDFLRSPVTPATGFAFSKLETFGYSSGFFRGASSNAANANGNATEQNSVSRSNSPRPEPVLRRFRSAFAASKSQPSTPQSDAAPALPALPIPKKKIVQLLRTKPTTDVHSDSSVRSTKSSRRKNALQPVPYSTIVELNMFFEGGSKKDWIARSQQPAKELRPEVPTKPLPELPAAFSPIPDSILGGGVEVGGFEDDNGAIWWDETEKLEFASLLPKDDASILTATTTTAILSDDSSWVDVDTDSNTTDLQTGESSSSDASLECLLDELQEMVTLGAVKDRKHLRSASASAVPFVVPSRPRKSKAAPAYLFPVELAAQKTGSIRGRRSPPPPPLTLVPASPTSEREVVASAGPIASARHFHFGGGVHHQHSHSYSYSQPSSFNRPQQGHARSLSFEDSFMSHPPEEIAFASYAAKQVALEQQRQMQDRQWQTAYAATRSLTSQKNTKKAALGAFFKGFGKTTRKPGMF